MKSEPLRYPVDRYLVESSKNVEMVNIIDDDIWKSEPALRPEDEIILRKLHEMLQSTADDLKLLSGELARHREPGVQIRTLPTPFDDEFNEKVHIEEVVNAKFHGHKIIDKLVAPTPVFKNNEELLKNVKPVSNNLKKKVHTGIQVDTVPTFKKPTNTNLVMSRTKVLQIDEKKQDNSKASRLNNAKVNNNKSSTVTYNEYFYKYEEPKDNLISKRVLQVQDMPSINIRSELSEHKVLHLDILPESQDNKQSPTKKSNAAVITMQHEPPNVSKNMSGAIPKQQSPQMQNASQLPARKVSKMSTCESSGSTNNISSDVKHKKLRKYVKVAIKSPPRPSIRTEVKRKQKSSINKQHTEKKSQFSLDEWKKKLNAVYGQPSSSRKTSTKVKTNVNKRTQKNSTVPNKLPTNILNNNSDYIPYSQLTLGGVRVSDIEKEISDIPNKNNLPLSPILDRILSSRENSFHKASPRKTKEDHTKVLTTSDENLLQEVIDIERTVSKTLLNKKTKKDRPEDFILPNISSDSNNHEDVESYADDFEDEKSEADKESLKSSPSHKSNASDSNAEERSLSDDEDIHSKPKVTDIHNVTYTKKTNLSFKNKVDIYEFVHSVDTQDMAIQSTSSQKISLKETQTSPRNDRPNIQPIHNDLWPTVDSKGEVEKMFKLEKDFIKKLIIEEYGDLLEKSIVKPSTSKNNELPDTQNNVVSFQKNTQTSPARVKCIMTSPTRTKTRTTSPFITTMPVDQQTSPMICITGEEELKVEIENEGDDLGISINLSSPRFSLRLPQTSREVLSNFETSHQTPSKSKHKEGNQVKGSKTFRKVNTSSSSSLDADNSSSELSSLGEIKLKLRRKLRKYRVLSISDTSSSSLLSKYSSDLQSVGILPLRSEGEVSLGQTMSKKSNERCGSDGEMSAGRLG